MLEHGHGTSDDAQDATGRVALLEAENTQLRAGIDAHERRIKLLEEALRVLRADRWGASREKLGETPGQGGLFNVVETIVELAEAVGTEIELKATPLRTAPAPKGKPGRKAIASHLPRATQAAWMIGLTVPLTPLINLMDERLRESGYVRIDETPVQVLKSDRAPTAEHYT